MISFIKKNSLTKIVSNRFLELPTPRNITYFWNFGSLLGVCLGIQILTGLLLSIHYRGNTILAFSRVRHIMRDVNFGWLFRICHANGARIFFALMYTHIGRGIYYGSFYLKHTWMIGVTILLCRMATAFMGYVLPWGQISFWGATVITNLFSAIPVLGGTIVNWLWGGFAVDNATLNRFYSLHFLLPFLIAGLVMVHLLFLHDTGSSNPLGLSSNYDKIPFHPYFSVKDLLGFIFLFLCYFWICFFNPWRLGDPENFIPANPIVTPIHIQPEWYFLFAYAILRSIPNKLGGVIALAFSVIIFWVIRGFKKVKFKGRRFFPFLKIGFWLFVGCVILLTWIGARPVEAPFVEVGQVLTVIYFFFFFFVGRVAYRKSL